MRHILSRVDEARFKELSHDKRAARAVFDAAQQSYHDELVCISERELGWWKHLIEAYGLDSELKYAVKFDKLEGRAILALDDAPEEKHEL